MNSLKQPKNDIVKSFRAPTIELPEWISVRDDLLTLYSTNIHDLEALPYVVREAELLLEVLLDICPNARTLARNRQVEDELKSLFELIDRERFDDARVAIAALESKLGEDEPELTRASSLIRFLEGAP